MVEEGLAVIKCIDERYAPEKRNPYSDIEYGNHYTRAMSGYAPFVSITGFRYDANKKSIGFNPKFRKNDFKSAFITAAGWGSFSQKRFAKYQSNNLEIKSGELELKNIKLNFEKNVKISSIKVVVNDKNIKSNYVVDSKNNEISIHFTKQILKEKDSVKIILYY